MKAPAGAAGGSVPAKKTLVFLYLSVFLVSVVLYLPTLRHSFVWDDSDIRPFGPASDGLYSIFMGRGLYFRPFVVLSERLDFALWSGNPIGFHLTNIVMNGLASVGAFSVALLLLTDIPAALLATALFLTHPSHPDSVAWISGRTDVMASLFLFFGLASHMSFRSEGRRDAAALSPLFMLFSLFCKETALVFPLLVLAYDRIVKKVAWRKTVGVQLTLVPILIFYAFLRRGFSFSHALSELVTKTSAASSSSAASPTVIDRVEQAFLALGFYIKKILLPGEIVQYPDFSSTFNLVVAAFFVVCLLILVRRRRQDTALFGLLFGFLTLAPALLVLLAGDIGSKVAVRYVFIPVFGFSLCAGCFYGRAPRKKAVAIGLVVVVLCFTGMTVMRNAVWKNNMSLWSYEFEVNPGSAMAHVQYAMALQGQRRYDEADRRIDYLLTHLDSLRYRETMDIRCSMLAVKGTVAMGRRDIDRAETYFLRARDCNRKLRGVEFMLGNIELARYRSDHEIARLKIAERYFQDELGKGASIETVFSLAQTRELLGLNEQALQLYGRVIDMDPTSEFARNAFLRMQRMRSDGGSLVEQQ